MALPHLPANNIDGLPDDFNIQRGFNEIIQFARDSGVHYIVQVLFEYMERYWFGVVGPEQFSVYGAEIRTNNFIESFHSILRTAIGVHPPVWTFYSKYKLIN